MVGIPEESSANTWNDMESNKRLRQQANSVCIKELWEARRITLRAAKHESLAACWRKP